MLLQESSSISLFQSPVRPPRCSTEVATLRAVLSLDGLHAALKYLNQSTAFRYTGLYRFDAGVLCNVALYDRFQPGDGRGADLPMAKTWCAIVGTLDDVLGVEDGRVDPRFPWMNSSPYVSYCGAPVRNRGGFIVGTICHYDVKPHPVDEAALALLDEAAWMMYPAMYDHR